MSDIIQLRDITKTYDGNITAVDNLSLAVKEGEFVTFLGPSGCGKTTILRLIAGFETPTAGQVFLTGEDVTLHPPYERAVNTVFQDYALFPHMNIRDNVGYGLRVTGMPKQSIAPVVEEALSTVGLIDKAAVRPANLSGGQKQRVALARALVRKPKVLLLDEPLSALDAKLREAMQVELKHLHQKLGITFVFVTHDQKEALVMSDRVIVMDQGKIAQQGSPAELYDHPATPYVADFIGNSNKLYGHITAIEGNHVSVQVGLCGITGTPRKSGYVQGDKVVATVRPEKVLIWTDPNPPDDSFLLSGTVQDVLFHGSAYRIEVDIGSGTVFGVDVQLATALHTSKIPAVGEPISLAINPDTVSVFPLNVEPDS